MSRSQASRYKPLSFYYDDKVKPYNIEADSLFSGKNSEKYINQLFQNERKNRKVKKCLDRITPFRARHTVSAYLLGLTIRDKLQLDTKDWRRLPNEKSAAGSFRLFWSWVCIFHDIGYYYEDNGRDYLNCLTVEALIEKLNIEYNFLNASANRNLIQKYYRKRISDSNPVIDHGIIGALLLYDALMDMAGKDIPYSKIKQYKNFFAKICDAIALHNMWRATNSTINLYKQYELNELIPNEDNHHKIYYKDNALLFLLAVVDSADPIKFFCRDGRYKNPILPEDVIYNFHMGFSIKKGTKSLLISYKTRLFDDYIANLSSPNGGLNSWLGVYSSYNSAEDIFVISIDTSGNEKKEGEPLL